ncbi:L-rhamnose mutarotase [Asticcacaulis sp. EMRT-3]|uniref:L-rhamnose mutarotase n=1 Tax=Asticcacaulis sp. EMRT-3 TaxID=3040349 RepID=UPI0024AF1233|nr:L-rhamnose mutarotase [Asticcacaulis sp. EMRT-3]MDI7775077.1 L-rhamnose mutarotase [Asticcacaulis sp. EMRT-3]
MEPIYYILDLKDDPAKIESYKAWHQPGKPPEAVTRAIREAGIAELEIFLTGNRMVMVLTPGPDFDHSGKNQSESDDPQVQAWETLMWQFQQALPFAAPGEKWVRLEKIYALSAQP